MFDVDWADPTIERIGERRARKERDGDRESKKKDEGRSVRESISSRSSLSSGDKTTASFLGNLGLKFGTASLRSKKGTNPLYLFTDGGSSKRASVLSQSATAAAFRSTNSYSVSNAKPFGPLLPIDGIHANCPMSPSDDSTHRSSKGSVLSKSTGLTTPISPSPSRNVVIDSTSAFKKNFETYEAIEKPLQTAELTLDIEDVVKTESFMAPEPKTPKHLQTPISSIEPSSDVSTIIHKWFTSVRDEVSPLPPSVSDGALQSQQSGILLDLRPPSSPISNPLANSAKDELVESKYLPVPFEIKVPSSPSKSSLIRTLSQHRSGFSPNAPANNTSAKLGASNPDAWKPPDTWKSDTNVAVELPIVKGSGSPISRGQAVAADLMALDLSAMQREIARMATTSDQIVIARLNEDWGNSNDATFYKELEMEKKRWMLSALYNVDKPGENDMRHNDALEGAKILALFESQATASYLAALYPKSSLTHIAPKPLSSTLFPNTQPIKSSVVTALRSLPANSYMAVYCLSMPSMFSGQDIPRVLRNVHRCLAPKGVLHLTLMNPSPASQSIGPRMRQWLDQNLMINVEARFRCVNPSRLFPAWLADARLRASGSRITKVTFRAINKLDHGDQGGMMQSGEAHLKLELSSVVGRKLWQEVWGSFVMGNAWWWDDPDCVEECLRLNTYFEYALIEATKDTV